MSNNNNNIKSTPNKNIFDTLIEKLTPNKNNNTNNNLTPQHNNKRATFNGTPTPQDNNLNSTPQNQQSTNNNIAASQSSTNLLNQLKETIQNDITNQTPGGYSTNLDDFADDFNNYDDQEKYLKLSQNDSTVIINKDLVGSDHYINSIEPQLSILNKPVKKEPKPLVKQQSFKNNQHYLDSNQQQQQQQIHQQIQQQSHPNIQFQQSQPPTNHYQQNINNNIINNNNNNNINNNINNNTNQQTSQPNNIQSQQQKNVQKQSEPVNNKQQKPSQSSNNQQQSNNNLSQQQQSNNNQNELQQFIDLENFTFNNLDIPMSCKLFLDRLKSENSELKRQLNIVLNDNAEQWEQTIFLQNNLKELEDYNQQLDKWSDALRGQLMNSAELLVNHHKKIDNLYELLSGIGEQKDSFQNLYEQSQEQLARSDEENLKLTFELKDYKKLSNDLNLTILDLRNEIKSLKDYSIETIIWRIKNNIEPSGIERKKSIQEKSQLLDEAVRVYQFDYNELVLLRVISFLKNTLSWKVFIQLLKNNYESLDYYIKYCKQTKKNDQLKLIYRETHNHLEEGLIMLKEALDEKDTNLQIYSLYSCCTFFEQYDHLHFYKTTILKYIDSIRNGINLNYDNLDNFLIRK